MACFVCLADGREHTDEHVVPASLGGALLTRTFCADCNGKLGREVDEPFARYRWIQEERARYQIPDRYGRVPDPPRVPATVDGVRAVVTMGTPWTVETFPEDEIEGDAFRFTVRADQEEEVVKKKLERLAGRHGHVELGSKAPVPNTPLTAKFEEKLSLDLWPRFTAKLTLGIASLLPDAWTWRQSVQAEYLASVALNGIRDTRPGEIALQPMAKVLERNDLLSRLVAPPAHFIWIDEGGRFLAAVLFGHYLSGAALGESSPGRNAAWLFDPQARRVRSGSYAALVGEMSLALSPT
jgi:hypothetical protein